MKGIRLIPPVYFLLSLGAMALLHWRAPVARLIGRPWSYAGAGLILTGLVLAAVSAMRFARRGTTVHAFHQAAALVTDGPYRFTRNPMYLGMATVLSGIAVWLGSLTPFLVIPVFMLAIQELFIKHEERRLTELFGAAYAEYRSLVRRWI